MTSKTKQDVVSSLRTNQNKCNYIKVNKSKIDYLNPVIKTYKILVHKACLYVHDKLLLHGMFYYLDQELTCVSIDQLVALEVMGLKKLVIVTC